MPKCSYCGKQYEFPRGLTLVKTDNNIKYLCSAKCRKNMLMGKRKIRWILKSAEGKEKEAKRKKKNLKQ
jgi:ribosomal protein L24E